MTWQIKIIIALTVMIIIRLLQPRGASNAANKNILERTQVFFFFFFVIMNLNIYVRIYVYYFTFSIRVALFVVVTASFSHFAK